MMGERFYVVELDGYRPKRAETRAWVRASAAAEAARLNALVAE